MCSGLKLIFRFHHLNENCNITSILPLSEILWKIWINSSAGKQHNILVPYILAAPSQKELKVSFSSMSYFIQCLSLHLSGFSPFPETQVHICSTSHTLMFLFLSLILCLFLSQPYTVWPCLHAGVGSSDLIHLSCAAGWDEVTAQWLVAKRGKSGGSIKPSSLMTKISK